MSISLPSQVVSIEHVMSSILLRQPKGLYDPAQYMITLGGKRIRPLLCLLSHQLFNAEKKDIKKLCAAIEIFHNFTLVHDDIMDQAALRRGLPTVHTKWNANQAILSGDILLIEAFECISSLQDKKHLPIILKEFIHLSRLVCVGQQLDMEFEQQTDIALTEYEEMIRLKTAVLLGGSMRLGALYADATQAQAEQLYQIGEQLGVVFQIQDDYLDAFGGIAFGKQVGGDILASKKTFLYLKALQNISPSQKQDFINIYHSKPTDSKVQQVMEIYDSLDLQTLIAKEIEHRYTQAIDPLKHMEGDALIKQELLTMIEGLFHRKT